MNEKVKQVQQYIRDFNEFKKSESYMFILFLNENRTMLSILSKNYFEFNKVLKYHDDDNTIRNIWISDVYFRNRLQKEITRHLLNYLSNIFIVVDYSRKSVIPYLKKNEEIFQQYQLMLKEYHSNARYHKFIQDLRNYTSHNTYIKIGSEFSYNIEWEKPRKSVFTTRDELLKWDGWCKESKNLIESFEDKIRLNEILKSHYNEFMMFQNWIFLKIFKVDVENSVRSINELGVITSKVKQLNQKNLFAFSGYYLRLLRFCYKKAE